MNVAIYCRVSTEVQNVKQQIDYIKDWCVKQGHVVTKIVSDEESGRLPLLQRKKFSKLLNESILPDSNFEAIVIHNLDRITRNFDDVVVIEKHFRENWDKCKLISASDSIDLSNASGRLSFRIRMSVSCYTPEDMMEKQRIGIDRAKREGKYTAHRGNPRNKDRGK